jgi:hypothetical protein
VRKKFLTPPKVNKNEVNPIPAIVKTFPFFILLIIPNQLKERVELYNSAQTFFE